MTARQFTAWMEWEADNLNVPTKQDHYLAQIALEVRRSNQNVKQREWKYESFLVKYKKDNKPVEKSEEQKRLELEQDKAIIMGRIGKAVKRPDGPKG